MEPQLVKPLEDTDQPPLFWPRILKIVAALSFIFALVTTINSAFRVYWILNSPGSQGSLGYISMVYQYQAARGLLAIARAAVGTFMLIAAFRLWRHGLWHIPLLMAARLWLAIWLLEIALPLITNRRALEFISGTAVQGIVTAAFPLMIVLILREYSKAHP